MPQSVIIEKTRQNDCLGTEEDLLPATKEQLEEARRIALKKKSEKLSPPKKTYMDEANKKAMNVWVNEGETAAIKHMFTDQETGRERSYAEMRMLYG